MSISFMTECHSFIRLDNIPVDDAIKRIRNYVEETPTYGFVGCKGEHGSEIYQWNPDEDWEPKVREMMK
jgi:hypothetical protein